MKTSELGGYALDRLAALADGHIGHYRVFHPSANWAHGGPIIEREGIRIERIDISGGAKWEASLSTGVATSYYAVGPTPLVAAMLVFVTSKYGETAPDIPA